MNRPVKLVRKRFNSMGCPAEICVYSHSEQSANRAWAIARAEAQRLDLKYSSYRTNNYFVLLQQRAAQPGGASPDAETSALLNFASCQYRQSDGCFDITTGQLSRLWERSASIPASHEIDQAMGRTGWHKVAWDGHRLGLPGGMRLDLGGIVKEYAADRVALLLRKAGFNSGYIDLGGDLHIIGPHPDSRPWRVGIRHPRNGGVLAGIDISHGGLASSGDYERFRMIDGQRYSHLIDARSGWPVQGLASVSVWASSCLIAGAVTTLAMLLGRQQGLDLLAESGLGWLAHDGHGRITDQSSTASYC
ncbi:MAG: FAD:protein FMN transferase [Xanthomonadales bacterium]|nr:FAD:protein FMN transferase [Xanthomonadales bacterium]